MCLFVCLLSILFFGYCYYLLLLLLVLLLLLLLLVLLLFYYYYYPVYFPEYEKFALEFPLQKAITSKEISLGN